MFATIFLGIKLAFPLVSNTIWGCVTLTKAAATAECSVSAVKLYPEKYSRKHVNITKNNSFENVILSNFSLVFVL